MLLERVYAGETMRLAMRLAVRRLRLRPRGHVSVGRTLHSSRSSFFHASAGKQAPSPGKAPPNPDPPPLPATWTERLRAAFQRVFPGQPIWLVSLQQLGGFSILMSYMTKDILWLRALAISGIMFFNMVPNTFKKNYPNIAWGFLFLGFNLTRLVELIRERSNVEFTKTELEVYESKFHKFMTPRCFQRILTLAEWRQLGANHSIKSPNEMMLVVEGGCELHIDGRSVFKAPKGSFINLPNLTKDKSKRTSESATPPEDPEPDTAVGETGGNTVDASSSARLAVKALEPTRFLVWNLDVLLAHLETDEAAFTGLLHVVNEALLSNVIQRDQLHVNERYTALLRKVIEANHRTIPADEKMALAAWREANGVSDEEHRDSLQSLGWSAQEYDWGAHRDAARAHAALLRLSKRVAARAQPPPASSKIVAAHKATVSEQLKRTKEAAASAPSPTSDTSSTPTAAAPPHAPEQPQPPDAHGASEGPLSSDPSSRPAPQSSGTAPLPQPKPSSNRAPAAAATLKAAHGAYQPRAPLGVPPRPPPPPSSSSHRAGQRRTEPHTEQCTLSREVSAIQQKTEAGRGSALRRLSQHATLAGSSSSAQDLALAGRKLALRRKQEAELDRRRRRFGLQPPVLEQADAGVDHDAPSHTSSASGSFASSAALRSFPSSATLDSLSSAMERAVPAAFSPPATVVAAVAAGGTEASNKRHHPSVREIFGTDFQRPQPARPAAAAAAPPPPSSPRLSVPPPPLPPPPPPPPPLASSLTPSSRSPIIAPLLPPSALSPPALLPSRSTLHATGTSRPVWASPPLRPSRDWEGQRPTLRRSRSDPSFLRSEQKG